MTKADLSFLARPNFEEEFQKLDKVNQNMDSMLNEMRDSIESSIRSIIILRIDLR